VFENRVLREDDRGLKENAFWEVSRSVCLNKYYSGNQIEKSEIGESSGTYRRRGDMHTEFWWRNLRERDKLEDPDVDGKIILKLNINKYYVGHGLN
jgi:hypothetical protein